MPPLGLAMGGVDFSDKAIVLKDAVAADPAGGIKAQPAVVLKYGVFINEVINFLIVAIAVFILIKAINTARKRFERQQEVAPPAPTTDQKLLMEIRDAIKARA
jgi:large conductance mechanosensitive channel